MNPVVQGSPLMDGCVSGMWGVAMNIKWIWEFLIRWKYNAEAENQLIFGQVLPMMCVIS